MTLLPKSLARSSRCFVIWVLALSVASALPAARLKIIANPQLPISEVTLADLKSIFLLSKTTLNSSRVIPVLDTATLAQFCGEYLGKTSLALEIYYRSRVFAGVGSMPARYSDSATVAYVARTPGAIAYVSDDTVTTGVKTLRVRPTP
jgi:hypothetical protein